LNATAAKRPNPVGRFNRNDWLDCGLGCLKADGPSALTLESLCAAAGRTRGSFYHHFADHDAFIEALMKRWQWLHTDQVIEQVEQLAIEQPTASRPMSLHELSTGLDHRLELEVRRLGNTHPLAESVLKQVDASRLAYLEKLYIESGNISPQKAFELARLEYALFVGLQTLWPGGEAFDFEASKALYQKLSQQLSQKLIQQPAQATRKDQRTN